MYIFWHHYRLFSRYDLSRILFGSDLVNPVAFRGNYIRLGMSWHVVTPQDVARDWGLESRATFTIYENLSALFHAARFCHVSEENIQNIQVIVLKLNLEIMFI